MKVLVILYVNIYYIIYLYANIHLHNEIVKPLVAF